MGTIFHVRNSKVFLLRTHFNEELRTLNLKLQSMLFQAPVIRFDLRSILYINQNKMF